MKVPIIHHVSCIKYQIIFDFSIMNRVNFLFFKKNRCRLGSCVIHYRGGDFLLNKTHVIDDSIASMVKAVKLFPQMPSRYSHFFNRAIIGFKE